MNDNDDDSNWAATPSPPCNPTHTSSSMSSKRTMESTNQRSVRQCVNNNTTSSHPPPSLENTTTSAPPPPPLGLVPLDRSLIRNMMNTNTKKITIDKLLNEDPRKIERQSKMDLQLLRVIANNRTTNSNLGPARVYGSKSNN